MLVVGKGIWREGSYWNITNVVHEHNEMFQWSVVTAEWSRLGPMPTWHKVPRSFVVGYRPRDKA